MDVLAHTIDRIPCAVRRATGAVCFLGRYLSIVWPYLLIQKWINVDTGIMTLTAPCLHLVLVSIPPLYFDENLLSVQFRLFFLNIPVSFHPSGPMCLNPCLAMCSCDQFSL